MTNNMTITQKAAVGSDPTQIGTQNNNYYGLTPAEASQMAVGSLYEQFSQTARSSNEDCLGKSG